MQPTKKMIRALAREMNSQNYRKAALAGGGAREVARRKRQLEKRLEK